jgi:hypothetical protein
MAYLAACVMYRDNASYLREWIEFHKLVGVERFFLYDNLSTDEHQDVVAPYLESGTAVLHDWSLTLLQEGGRPSGLRLAYEHCLRSHRSEARWIAFLDIDEFLFSPTGRAVAELLPEYERWPGVCVSRAEFGTSGHRARPPGLVIESYVERAVQPPDAVGFYKSIVDPARTLRCSNYHEFAYAEGFPVDENFRAIPSQLRQGTSYVSCSRLRINHYWMKSEEEFEAKQSLWRGVGQPLRRPPARRLVEAPGERDEEITRYLPALRDSLAIGRR